MGTGEGSYSFFTPLDSIVPVRCRRRSSEELKNTKSNGMTNGTIEEKLWADYPHAVWIRQGIFNSLAIITIPNVKMDKVGWLPNNPKAQKSQSYIMYIPDKI